MSLTPKDSSDSRGDSQPSPGDRGGGPSVWTRAVATLDGVRALVGRARTTAVEWFFAPSERERRAGRTTGPPSDAPDRDPSSAESLPVQQSTRSRSVRSPRPGNDSDLVAERDGDRLTIRHPDAQGERVESDTWMPVER